MLNNKAYGNCEAIVMLTDKISNPRISYIIPGVILAGGMSSRMGGGDKCLLKLAGETLLSRVIYRLKGQVTKIVLSANGDEGRFASYDIPVVSDSVKGFVGPLAGILSGLEWAKKHGFKNIVTVAADTPFFPENLVQCLLNTQENSDSLIAIAATLGSKRKKIRHPTFGLWPVSLCEDLRSSLESGKRKIVLWADEHDATDVLFPSENFDPFFNINNNEDFSIAKEILRGKNK